MATSSTPSTSTRTRPRWATRLLVALALGVAFLPALQPLLRGEISCGYDNAFHLYRAVEIQHLWDQGVLFTRWAPDMALGFGFPLFVFAGPLAQGLLAFIRLLGPPWPVAMNAVFALGVMVGGAGIYWLVTTLAGKGEGGAGRLRIAGGLLAAVGYVYAPFQAYDIFNRGSLWESLAWAFPPLILLGLHRWMMGRDRRFLALGVGALAAMVLCHYPFAALFAPVLGLWVVVHALVRRDWGILGRGVLVAALGLGTTAFFWLPPFLERDYIQTDRLLGTWVFDYRHNFLPLGHLLALPRRADPYLVNDWPQKSLGLVPVLLALLPAIGFRRLSAIARWQVGLLWALVAGLSALTLSPSLWLWDHVPMLSFVQFPWRFLGPAAFCLALLLGRVPEALFGGRERLVGPGTAALSVVLIAANLGWFYPDACSAPGNLTVPGIIRWERLTDTLGTTAKGEYLPIWVKTWPEVALDEAYEAGFPVVRMRPDDLPAGAQILTADYGAVSARIDVSSPVAFTARYLAFYYPGWRVTVDGMPAVVSPEPETGLVTFPVPAGTHTLVVRFGETPLRWVGNGISAAVLLLLLAILGLPANRRLQRTDKPPAILRSGGPQGGSPQSGSPEGGGPQPGGYSRLSGDRTVALWVLGGAVLLGIVKVVVIDTGEFLWRGSLLRPSTGALSGVAQPLAVNFENRALLLGSSALPQDVSAADTPVLTLYWRALDPGAHDWHAGLTLVGEDGSRWPVGTRPARWARTPPPFHEWRTDAYARMDLLLDLPVGLAPGTYSLDLALFDRATAAPASVLNEAGNPVAPAYALGAVRIAAPAAPPSLASLGVAPEAAVDCGPVRALGVAFGRETAAPGDLVPVRMVWESLAPMDEDLAVGIALVPGGAGGAPLRTWAFPPSAPWWPTSLWQPGQRWGGRADVRLPGSLESGTYTLALSVADCSIARQTLAVEAPDRIWQMPASFAITDHVFGAAIGLAGYEVPEEEIGPGETVALRLAWTALEDVTTSYRVFVHLVDGEGRVVAQNDGEPAGWTRPTPGWAPGEIIIDPRPLQVPETSAPGRYEIRVGLYDSAGQRLLTSDGADAATVTFLTLAE